MTECLSFCRRGDKCLNQRFQRRQYPTLKVLRTPTRGWGLHVLQPVKKGEVICTIWAAHHIIFHEKLISIFHNFFFFTIRKFLYMLLLLHQNILIAWKLVICFSWNVISSSIIWQKFSNFQSNIYEKLSSFRFRVSKERIKHWFKTLAAKMAITILIDNERLFLTAMLFEAVLQSTCFSRL